MLLKWSPVSRVQLHITLQSYLVSFLSCTRNCPLAGDFTEFFTNQFKNVGKAQITAADPRWALGLSHFAYDASTSTFLIHHKINVPWKLYKPQVWSAPSSPLYTNYIGNFTTVLLSKKYAIIHAMSKYFIIVNSPWYYTLFTSYAETGNSAYFNNLHES